MINFRDIELLFSCQVWRMTAPLPNIGTFHMYGYEFRAVNNNSYYEIYYHQDKKISSLYELMVIDDGNNFHVEKFIEKYYDINVIIETSDFDRICEIARLDYGDIDIYDPSKSRYTSLEVDESVMYETLQNLIANKLPFRYRLYASDDYKIIYCNTIRGEYKLHDPHYLVTNEDLQNIKTHLLMSKV